MANLKRLARDIEHLVAPEMKDLGIYYSFNDANMRKGQALIFGPKGTPYEDIPLIFSVEIPTEYPFQSPKVLIMTSDASTRFHPNLYIEGKVCLSILGTYTGPKWVSTMNVATIFKSIVSLLNENPITNEPGWETYTLEDPRAKAYAEWVEFNLLKHVVHEYRKFRSGGQQETLWEPFRDVFDSVFNSRWVEICKRIQEKAALGVVNYANIPYGMRGTADWPRLLAEAVA